MSVTFSDSFRGKSVFVTGHTGLKGSWLCLWLNRLGARVTGYALDPPTEPSNFIVSGVQEVLDEHHVADVRDLDRLSRAIQSAEPDVILHLAAQSVVRRGYRMPSETFETNVMGTVNVLESVRRAEHPCAVVCVTSDKCYENREQIWGYRESDGMGDHDPYGGSKGAAELVIRSYRDSFFDPERVAEHGIKLASGRAGNVIGGGDWTSDALLVDVVKSLSRDQTISIRSPNAFRPWQHVLQALSGYLTLAGELLGEFRPSLCSGWNFGPLPGSEIPVKQVVDMFLEEWGSGDWIDTSDPNAPHESTILRLSIDKAMWQLNWSPRWNVRQAIQQTVIWNKRYLQNGDGMQDFCLSQISDYEESLTLCDQLTTHDNSNERPSGLAL